MDSEKTKVKPKIPLHTHFPKVIFTPFSSLLLASCPWAVQGGWGFSGYGQSVSVFKGYFCPLILFSQEHHYLGQEARLCPVAAQSKEPGTGWNQSCLAWDSCGHPSQRLPCSPCCQRLGMESQYNNTASLRLLLFY